jgi:hypothetical protein
VHTILVSLLTVMSDCEGDLFCFVFSYIFILFKRVRIFHSTVADLFLIKAFSFKV